MSVFKRVLPGGAITFALLACAAAQSGSIQQQNEPAAQAQHRQQQHRLAVLAQRLNLTVEQKQQWLQIQKETTQKISAVRKDNSLTEEQMQARLKDIHKEQRERVLATLTPEQQAELKTFWEEQRQKQQSEDCASSGREEKNGETRTTFTCSSDFSAESKDKENTDDLFAGMVSDDPVPPPQGKKTTPK